MARTPLPARSEPPTAAHHHGSGELLVLLHPLHASWRAWHPVIPLLEGDHRVFAPTIPGHRGGPPLDGATDVSAMADGLERVLDAAGIGQAHLAGNSLGGWLALELAARGRASTVVAFSPAGSWARERDLRRLALLLRAARKVGASRPAAAIMRRPKLRRAALRVASEQADRMPEQDVEGMLLDLRSCHVLEGILAGIAQGATLLNVQVPASVPVRLAWPVRDRTLPFARYGRPLVQHMPAAELVRLSGVGHVPMGDDPQLVAATISTFVARHSAH